MSSKSLQGHYAGLVSRIVAFITDLIIVTLTIVVSTWVLGQVLNFFGLGAIFAIPNASDGFMVKVMRPLVLGLAGMSSSTFAGGYFLFFWVLTGQTPGKAIIGLRVVAMDGSRLTFTRAFRRLLGYWLAALPFFLGFIWILVDDRRQGWHDKFAYTCVIYTWDAHLEESFLVEALEKFEHKEIS